VLPIPLPLPALPRHSGHGLLTFGDAHSTESPVPFGTPYQTTQIGNRTLRFACFACTIAAGGRPRRPGALHARVSAGWMRCCRTRSRFWPTSGPTRPISRPNRR
jgi:hypothetical protein